MSRESEKALKAMHQFLDENGAEDMAMDDVNRLFQKFTEDYNSNLPGRITEKTAKTADDYLELAEEAPTKAKAEKYIKKALELEPDNMDAVSASLDLIEDDSTWEYYQKLFLSRKSLLWNFIRNTIAMRKHRCCFRSRFSTLKEEI